MTSEKQARSDEARRNDLDFAVGVVLSPPHHRPDVHGAIKYGVRPPMGWADDSITRQFACEMRDLIVEQSQILVDQRLLTAEEIGELQGRPYEVGPAAQSWSMFLYNLYLALAGEKQAIL
jgi:hypothetical protein